MNLNKNSGKNELYQQLISDGEVQRVPVNLVDRDPDQPRSINEVKAAAKDLARSIEKNGLVQLPVYWLQPNGRYLIVVGDCRTQAVKLLKQEEITAVVKTFEDTNEARQKITEIRWAENDSKTRKALTPLDEAAFWARYIEEFYTVEGEAKVKDAAEKLDQNPTRISQFLGIDRASTKVKGLIKKMQLTDYQLAYLMARMESYDGVLDQFTAKIESGEPTGGLQVLANKMLKAAKDESKQTTAKSNTVSAATHNADQEEENNNRVNTDDTHNDDGQNQNAVLKEQENNTVAKSNDLGGVYLNLNKNTITLSTVANQPTTINEDQVEALINKLIEWHLK